MALTWANSTSIKAKVNASGSWQATRTVTTFSSAATYKVGLGAGCRAHREHPRRRGLVGLYPIGLLGRLHQGCQPADGGASRPTTVLVGSRRPPSRATPHRARSGSTIPLCCYDQYAAPLRPVQHRELLVLDLQDGHRGRQRDALDVLSTSAAAAGVRLDAGRAVRSRPMLERIREMPGGIRLFLLYAFSILFLIGSALRYIVDQAITAPVSLPGLVAMVLLAYTIFTTTLVIQRKQAARATCPWTCLADDPARAVARCQRPRNRGDLHHRPGHPPLPRTAATGGPHLPERGLSPHDCGADGHPSLDAALVAAGPRRLARCRRPIDRR